MADHDGICAGVCIIGFIIGVYGMVTDTMANPNQKHYYMVGSSQTNSELLFWTILIVIGLVIYVILEYKK